MTTFHVPRSDNVDLIFDGEILADVSSQRPGNDHWTEIRIYRTGSDRYVTERIGRTTVPGEYDRVFVNVYDDPARIREGLQRPRPGQAGVYYLNNLAFEAIENAAQIDTAIQAALAERI